MIIYRDMKVQYKKDKRRVYYTGLHWADSIVCAKMYNAREGKKVLLTMKFHGIKVGTL